MKLVKVFAVFVVLHLLGWTAAHVYKSNNPKEILVVVDTSFAMKQHFPAMQRWIENLEEDARYTRILLGSDKAAFGDSTQIRSKDVLFRTVFGRLSADALKRYDATKADQKILLSDGSVSPSGWTVVTF